MVPKSTRFHTDTRRASHPQTGRFPAAQFHFHCAHGTCEQFKNCRRNYTRLHDQGGALTIAISMCNLHGTSFRDFQVEKSSKCSQQHHLRLGKTFHSFQHVVYIQRVVGLGIFSEPLNRTTGTPKPTIVEKWMDVW